MNESYLNFFFQSTIIKPDLAFGVLCKMVLCFCISCIFELREFKFRNHKTLFHNIQNISQYQSLSGTISYESALVFTGRRMCLGDVLARMELFLFLSSVLHVFHLELPEDQPLPSLRGNAGITVTPDTYKVVVTKCWVRYVFLQFIS
jgi:hypothetical protein